MSQPATKKRYLPTDVELDEGRPAVDYHDQWRAHRYDPDHNPEPAFEEIEIVETIAIQDGKKRRIRVAKDQVPAYERIVRAFDRDRKRGGK